MKKYINKQDVIATAQASGSQARTFKGAAKFLMIQATNNIPIERRGARVQRKAGRYLQEQFIRRGTSMLKRLGLWAMDDAMMLACEISHQITRPACKDLKQNWNYKQSRSAWAGGSHSIQITIDFNAPDVQGGSSKVWSDNGKWSGTNSHAHLFVTPAALSYFPTLNINGWIILDANRLADGFFEVLYVEQSRGFELRAVQGWVYNGSLFTRKKAAEKERAQFAGAAKKAD